MEKKVVVSKKKATKKGINPKSFRFSQETIDLLFAISEHESRNETNMLEVLVKEKAAALGIAAPKS